MPRRGPLSVSVTKDKLTILTLFAGRWHTREPFLHALAELDWPKEKIHLLWYTNALDQFVNCLKMDKTTFERMGFTVEIVHDRSIPQAYRVFHDGDQRSDEHLNTIATLYNSAWQYVRTDDVLMLEDDVLAQTHTLKRLTAVMYQDPTAVIVSGCVFDRHHPGTLFIWDVLEIPVPKNGSTSSQFALVPIGMPWGIRRVACTGFSCTLIRRSRLAKELQVRYPFRSKNPRRSHRHIGGTDLVFCLQNGWAGKSVYADFDVRPYHIDAQAKIH